MDDQQRARELACTIGVRYGPHDSCKIGSPFYAFTESELHAFAAALRAAPECPEGFVMVPVELSKHMEDEFRDALWIDANRHNEDVISGISDAWAAALAARPQGVK